jgi:hypothetical protein
MNVSWQVMHVWACLQLISLLQMLLSCVDLTESKRTETEFMLYLVQRFGKTVYQFMGMEEGR